MKFFGILIIVIPAVLAVCQPNGNDELGLCVDWCQKKYEKSPETNCFPIACNTC
ncbi:hypothetical protein PTMSG1_08405, partial [Pyrenophora teres f. maculata]